MAFTRKLAKKKFRSLFEERQAKVLDEHNVPYGFETECLEWTDSAVKKYTPDFILTKKNREFIYVEMKGHFYQGVRKKMINVKKCHPYSDIRFVFQDHNKKINKGSKTTYGEWATKQGFPWADRQIPLSWTEE